MDNATISTSDCLRSPETKLKVDLAYDKECHANLNLT